LSQSLFTAQLGLVTVWAVLGTARWTMRVPVVLVLLVPLMGNIAQTAALCLICLVLRSQRFRLILAAPATDSEAISTAEGPALRPIQFGMRDVLLWTTALAPLLAIVRIDEGRMLTAGVLHAIVLVVALWTALGKGPAWLRWPLLLLFALVAGFVLVKVDEFHIGWRPPFTPFWRVTNLHYFWLWQWKTVAEFLLAGGMLAATLLIYRVLGYRLCRDLPRRAAI
ncbi:MAG TPA: hypothetical protein VKH44_08915, partial [Pirellulaceae bacterium]|nr:hypothetical protein [Pirellulaceae bacterium]